MNHAARRLLPPVFLAVLLLFPAQEVAAQGMQVSASEYLILNPTIVGVGPTPGQPPTSPLPKFDVAWSIETSSGTVRNYAVVTPGPFGSQTVAISLLQTGQTWTSGKLVNVSVGTFTPSASPLFAGNCYVQVWLSTTNRLVYEEGDARHTSNANLLVGGNLHSGYTISWPNTPVKLPLDEPGWITTLLPQGMELPGPGAQLNYLFPMSGAGQPSNCDGNCLRYRLISVAFTMQTGSNDAGAVAFVGLKNGADRWFFVATSPAPAAASSLTWHMFGAGMAPSSTNYAMTQALPNDLFLTGYDGPQRLIIGWFGPVGQTILLANIAVRVEAWNDID